ncbi:hypothetical protein U3516DRAFT_921265 [Neocallimastix sp. 'constans']|jgi:ankyrin repeat protein
MENEAVIKYLVDHGADVNEEDKRGEISLLKACLNGNEAIVQYLVKHIPINIAFILI